jgi:hypothetical protein
MKLEKLGGVLFNNSPIDKDDISKPKLFIIRKIIMAIIKFLTKLIKGD